METNCYKNQFCSKVEELVRGPREEDYGETLHNFLDIAALWSYWKGVEFTPTDVGMMMALLKIARLQKTPTKEDSLLDTAGYLTCVYYCQKKEEEENKKYA